MIEETAFRVTIVILSFFAVVLGGALSYMVKQVLRNQAQHERILNRLSGDMKIRESAERTFEKKLDDIAHELKEMDSRINRNDDRIVALEIWRGGSRA